MCQLPGVKQPRCDDMPLIALVDMLRNSAMIITSCSEACQAAWRLQAQVPLVGTSHLTAR